MGVGLILIDVPEGPADVAYITGPPSAVRPAPLDARPFDRRKTGRLCVTPCWIELPHGHHTFSLTLHANRWRRDLVTVPVTDTPSVYRRALGWSEDYWVGTRARATLLTAGAAHMMTIAIAPAMLFLHYDISDGADSAPLFLGVGAVALAVVIVAWSVLQDHRALEQEGASVLFPATSEVPPTLRAR